MRSRLGTLVGLLVVAGLVALFWVLAPDEASEEGESPSPAESSTLPSTTIEPSTTTSSPTTTAPPALFVNDTPGAVIDEHITGTVVALGRRTLYRVDLATGRVETFGLQRGFSEVGPDRRVIIGDLLVTNSWSGPSNIFTTDLRTGEQLELEVPLGMEPGDVVGQAGPDSFWLEAGDRIIYEMDMAGTVVRQVDIPEPFWVPWARDDILFLDGPGGLFAYDTVTDQATEVEGSIQFAPLPLLLRCDESLDCRVLVLTETGEVEVPGVGLAGLWGWAYETIDVSSDHTGALFAGWIEDEEDGEPVITYIDLVSGERIDLEGPDIDLWAGAAWIPDTRWVVARPEDGTTFLTALNTETGQRIDLDIPRQSVLNPDFEALVYEPAAGSTG